MAEAAWRRLRRGARRWRWCAAVAQRRSSARWQQHDSGVVMEAPIGPLRVAWARLRPPVEGGDAAGATAAGASSGDGQRGSASTAASRRSTEEVDRALSAEIKTWKESDTRMPALLAERSAAVE